jgi:hypothetical protein
MYRETDDANYFAGIARWRCSLPAVEPVARTQARRGPEHLFIGMTNFAGFGYSSDGDAPGTTLISPEYSAPFAFDQT